MKQLSQSQIAALFRAYHAAKIAADKATALSKEIKTMMNGLEVSKMEAGGFVASVTVVEGRRFDTKRFATDHPELYEQYMVSQVTERLNFK